MGMINLGKKPNQGMEISTGTPKNKVYYPDLMVTDIDLGFSDKDAGKPFTATIKGVVRRVSKTARADGSKDNSVDLEIHGIDFGGKSKSIQKSTFDSFYYGKKK